MHRAVRRNTAAHRARTCAGVALAVPVAPIVLVGLPAGIFYQPPSVRPRYSDLSEIIFLAKLVLHPIGIATACNWGEAAADPELHFASFFAFFQICAAATTSIATSAQCPPAQ